MVLLHANSDVDKSKTPFLFWWDDLRRQRHNFYEEQISRKVDGMQKMMSNPWLFSRFFPSFAQASLVELDIQRKMQTLGDYTQTEVDVYQKNNPSIGLHLSHTFGSPFPKAGAAVGTAFGLYFVRYRMNFFQVLLIGAIPAIFEKLAHRWNVRHRYEAVQFLDWTIQQRVSKANLERFSSKVESSEIEKFNKNNAGKTVIQVYAELLKNLQ